MKAAREYSEIMAAEVVVFLEKQRQRELDEWAERLKLTQESIDDFCKNNAATAQRYQTSNG